MNAFVWLVRRELWESRAVWIAPGVCAAIILGGLLLTGVTTHTAMNINGADLSQLSAKLTPQKLDALAGLGHALIAVPFLIAILFTQFFYTLDALYGERRDRSVLFWKSLPLADAETVLSKLFVAGVLIPVVGTLAAAVTQVLAIAIVSIKLGWPPLLAGHFWSPATWAGSFAVDGYVLVTILLWYLPLIGWLLLVSAWAPRSPFMWAALPPLALSLAEAVILRSAHVWHAIAERAGFRGLIAHSFAPLHGVSSGPGAIAVEQSRFELAAAPVELIRPGMFFASPSVWIGIAVGVAFVLAAIALRRYRDESN